MSEFKNTRDVSTCKKLTPPKSLQGEEDADATWDLILKRYPNAAPLLCQMETVIDKAEGLLQQLRSPYTHVLERSSSFQIADSEDELMGACHVEESTEVSMISEQDSVPASVDNMTPEIVSIANCSLSDKISDDYNEGKSVLEQVCSVEGESSEILNPRKEAHSLNVSSSSIYESNLKNFPEEDLKIKQDSKSAVSSIVNLTEIQTSSKKLLEDQEIIKSSSLEAWGKVVGEKVTLNQTRHSKHVESTENSLEVVDTKEDSVSEHARRLNAIKIGPCTIQQVKKENLVGKKEELVQRFAGTIATASKVLDSTISVEKNEGIQKETVIADGINVSKDSKIEYSERKINEFGDRTRTNSSACISRDFEEPKENIEANLETIKKSEFNEVQGNGDEAVSTSGVGPRSPVEILDEYSKICGIAVEYKNQSPSCRVNKNVVVKCCFGGFAFEACAGAKKIAKKDAAGKLLRCLAGRQIDGENMADLTPFTRKQIKEIISLGNGGEHETAVRKLYKICMELNAPEPIYTVHQDSGIVGNRYTVKCGALGITTSGYGIRILLAKRVAADELLHNYHENLNTVH